MMVWLMVVVGGVFETGFAVVSTGLILARVIGLSLSGVTPP